VRTDVGAIKRRDLELPDVGRVVNQHLLRERKCSRVLRGKGS